MALKMLCCALHGRAVRGYRMPRTLPPTRKRAPASVGPAHWYARGIRVRFCNLCLAGWPRLAGIKYLNRREQVLARAEWRDDAIAEGLMLDKSRRAFGVTSAKLFAVLGSKLVTLRVDQAGIAGAGRALLLKALPARQTCLMQGDLACASDLMSVPPVRGTLTVRQRDALRWPRGHRSRRMYQLLAADAVGGQCVEAERAQ